MKTKGILILFCCALAAAFALGAAGIIDFASAADAEAAGADRLIGVLLTRESLNLHESDDFSGDFSWDELKEPMDGAAMFIQPGQTNQPGRVYASFIEETDEEGYPLRDYTFDSVDGHFIYHALITDVAEGWHPYGRSNAGEGFSDFSVHVNASENGEDVSLSARVYLLSGSDYYFWFNPVYQTSQGEVYATAGECVRLSDYGTSGDAFVWSIHESRTASGIEERSWGMEVKLSLSFMPKPESVRLLQFGGQNELLGSTDLSNEGEPEVIHALPGAQYMIVETASSEGVLRELSQYGDEYAEAFYARTDGLCSKISYEIDWASAR